MVSFCSLCSLLLAFSFVFLSRFENFVDAQTQDHYNSTASLPTRWTNNATADPDVQFGNSVTIQAILVRVTEASGPAYACGFYCHLDSSCNTFLFAIFIVPIDRGALFVGSGNDFPEVVWSANRNNGVKIGATLELTSEGDLVLKDADGTVAWSTNSSGKSVVGLNMTDSGNLVLFDKNNMTVWQSFDQPTDTLVTGQKLMAGQRLMTADGMITLSVNDYGFSAQMETSPPQMYYQPLIKYPKNKIKSAYLELVNGSLALFSNSTTILASLPVPRASSVQHIQLGSDGHLKLYEYGTTWGQVPDLLTEYIGVCGYPTLCGQYGICTGGVCSSCPASSGGTSYFKPVDDTPDLGCSENVSLSCGASQYQSFLELENVRYFTFTADIENIDASSCKEACIKNCSCKAAIFRHGSDPTGGSCYLPTQVFTLTNEKKNTTVYLKVQNVANEVPNTSVDNRRSNHLPVILGSSLGALFAMMFLTVVTVLFVRKRDDNEAEEDYLDHVPGMPTRFTYKDLKAITDDFSKKLGEGGFGYVYEGTLIDGTKVAVKCLDGFGQVKKSFLAEVETIGSIHHVNLVRLVGFCDEKSHRLLIYEYMSNGSLDRWIFRKSSECVLDWQQRKKIILDIAKGLKYLHEDCRQKIIHLDIKPQNILLDGIFNAKVADFGLSKLIDRDLSRVITTMRGTPGYLAPEWLTAAITEKVDVYSFGVVILEMVCGRKIFDRSLDEEDMHLLSLFSRKAEEERLLDIVDDCSEDMQLNGPEAVNVLGIAAWCLQGDYTKRPSMSIVIKVLEGVLEVPDGLDYNFSAPPSNNGAAKFSAATALAPSVLSGPR